MRSGIFARILSFIGIEEEWEAEEAAAQEPEREPQAKARRGALVSLPGGQTFRVIVARPRSFEDVQGMADQLKSGRPVVMNLEGASREIRTRIINFLSGVIYALDGQMQRVGGGILLFAPHNVDVEYTGLAEQHEDDEEPLG